MRSTAALLLLAAAGAHAVTPYSSIPMLSPGTHAGVVLSSTPKGQDVVGAAYQEVIKAGADLFPIQLTWSQLEAVRGRME